MGSAGVVLAVRPHEIKFISERAGGMIGRLRLVSFLTRTEMEV